METNVCWGFPSSAKFWNILKVLVRVRYDQNIQQHGQLQVDKHDTQSLRCPIQIEAWTNTMFPGRTMQYVLRICTAPKVFLHYPEEIWTIIESKNVHHGGPRVCVIQNYLPLLAAAFCKKSSSALYDQLICFQSGHSPITILSSGHLALSVLPGFSQDLKRILAVFKYFMFLGRNEVAEANSRSVSKLTSKALQQKKIS